MKPFTWSYSRLKNYETCPRRYQQTDILKNFQDTSEALTFGNQLHEAIAKYIDKAVALPIAFKAYQSWADKMKGGDFTTLVEQKYAIRQDFGPTTYFAKDVWYRGVADVVRIRGPVALAVDWKTGKVLEDGVQLALMAQCIFSHHPEVQAIRTEFVWLKEDTTTREDFTRGEMAAIWSGLMPRVTALKQAYDANEYPPKTGHLCNRWCPVTTCEHNGRKDR